MIRERVMSTSGELMRPQRAIFRRLGKLASNNAFSKRYLCSTTLSTGTSSDGTCSDGEQCSNFSTTSPAYCALPLASTMRKQLQVDGQSPFTCCFAQHPKLSLICRSGGYHPMPRIQKYSCGALWGGIGSAIGYKSIITIPLRLTNKDTEGSVILGTYPIGFTDKARLDIYIRRYTPRGNVS